MAKILPVFLPFASCGNKCIFCDQQAISGVKAENNLIILAENQIKTWLSYGTSYDEIAFYGGNFAAIKSFVCSSDLEKAGGMAIRLFRG